MIASLLDCDEHDLGGPSYRAHDPELVQVRRLAVEASAGSGTIIDRESQLGKFSFPRQWLRQITNGKVDDLSLIRVKGESMAPTLVEGEEALVDKSRRELGREDGVYVLRRDDALMVKRLTVIPGSGLLTISSDNPAYPSWHNCSFSSLEIIGRVVGKIGPVR